MTEYPFIPVLFAKKPHNAGNMISFHMLNLSYPWVEVRNSEGGEHNASHKALGRQAGPW